MEIKQGGRRNVEEATKASTAIDEKLTAATASREFPFPELPAKMIVAIDGAGRRREKTRPVNWLLNTWAGCWLIRVASTVR